MLIFVSVSFVRHINKPIMMYAYCFLRCTPNHRCSVGYVLNVSGKSGRILTCFIMWTNFTFFSRYFYIILMNYQPRFAGIYISGDTYVGIL